MQPSTLRHLFLLLALSWAILIFYLSSQPGTDKPMLFFGQDKLFHFIAFGTLGFLAMGAAKETAQGYSPRQVWLTITLVAVYGILDEFHQHFVPGRVADFYDVIADMVGGMFGAWVMYYLLKKLTRKQRER